MSEAALYSLRFGFSLQTCKASNIGMLLVVRFLNIHELYCIEACENFIIHYANIRQNGEKTQPFLPSWISPKHKIFLQRDY